MKKLLCFCGKEYSSKIKGEPGKDYFLCEACEEYTCRKCVKKLKERWFNFASECSRALDDPLLAGLFATGVPRMLHAKQQRFLICFPSEIEFFKETLSATEGLYGPIFFDAFRDIKEVEHVEFVFDGEAIPHS